MLRQLALSTLFVSAIALPAYSTPVSNVVSNAVNPDPTVSPNPVARPKLPDFLPPENPGIIRDDRMDRPAFSQTIPKALVTSILQDIQMRWRIPARNLSLSVAEVRTWDSCLGIPPVNGICAKIAIQGWQVVIQGQNRNWVYHIDNSGKRLAYNAIASQPRPTAQSLMPKFVVENTIVPVIGENVIFQSATVTGHVRAYYATTLSENGVVMRRMLNRSDLPDSKPTVLKTLTPQQVQQFKKILASNRFSHFDRMSYFNNDAIAADAMSLQFSSFGRVTEYTLSNQVIPKNLMTIADVWSELLKES